MKEDIKQIFHSKILNGKVKNKPILKATDKFEPKKLKICVIDNGMFTEVPYTLAKTGCTVYYYVPFYDAFPDISKIYPAYGLEGVNKITNLYEHAEYNNGYYDFDDIDLFVFPDIGFGDLQEHLVELGKNVWGSRRGEDLEMYRWDAKMHFKSLGMAVNPMKTIKGISNLLKYLKTYEGECYYKISLIRGLFETRKHVTYDRTEKFLLGKIYDLGVLESEIEVIVETPIESICESGKDIFTVDGQLPNEWIVGYEDKGTGYICTIIDKDKLPKRITDVTYKLQDTFKRYGYRGWFSDEIKNAKNGKDYLLDFASRLGNPPAAIIQVLTENLLEVIYKGAQGIMVQPKYKAKYGVQIAMICPDAAKRNIIVDFPKSIREYVKLNFACCVNGVYSSIHQPIACIDSLGYVVGIGDTLDSAIEHCKSNAGKIQADSLEFDYNVFDRLRKYVKDGESIGIKFK